MRKDVRQGYVSGKAAEEVSLIVAVRATEKKRAKMAKISG
jgi:hypothetical protein